MDYYLTKHAKQRMVERGIADKLLAKALQKPNEIKYDSNGKTLFKYLYRSNNQARLLLIVAIPEKDRLKIITIIETSKVGKYL